MHGEAAEKIVGGKLVRIKVDFNDSITNIQISGDFFIDPEECFYEIESSLKNISVNFQSDEIVEKINEIAKKHSAEFVGISSEAIAKTLKEAIENGKMASNTS